jgi:hypothetical protein
MQEEDAMKRAGRAIAWMVCTAAVPAVASADEVFLVGGGRIVGEVVERRADAIVVEVGPGRLTLPASRVARIASGTSALAVYRERAARLGAGDATGWLALARWARDNDLETLASEAFGRVLDIDPSNQAAHAALGHVRLGGQWMSEAESYRARGYVQFQGSWMTSDEVQMIVAQHAAEAEARLAERQAVARAREAEARAQAAEADAARAAAEAEAAAGVGGIPYGWVFGPGYPPYITHGSGRGGHVGGRGGRQRRADGDRDRGRGVRPDLPKPPQRDTPPGRAVPRTTTRAVGRDERR